MCCCSHWAQAQRTLTFGEAQDAMRRNNLLLLAEQYNISAAEANVIQARIWELPVASGEINLINPEDKRVFDAGTNGQKALAIQQLIYLGGKKKAEVEFAKSNVGIARLQFEQLLRNLRLQLGQSFYTAFYDLRRLRRIDDQIHILDTLLSNYQSQTDKGNVPLKELVRLEALELNLRSNRTELSREILENRRLLSLLTAIPEEVTPQVPDAQLSERLQLPLMSRDSTVSYALANNLEYLTSQRIAESQELRLRWQRTLAIPDLTTGLSYDQRGGAFANQVNLTVGIPIPLWNRNRGNIKEAQARLTQSTYESTYKRSEIATLAASQYDIWTQENKQLANISPEILANLETVYQGMVTNFQRRNISLLEFTDFMESYNQSINQFNEIRKGWILAGLSLENTLNLNLF
ncbi:MAG: TolC family protein [Sphingobacteriales bacterium]|nr:MAG: TolC family protein [Sphingobacteriales bacterium]